MILIELPWPPRILSPNARAHWAPKSKAAKKYRETAHWLTLAAASMDDLAFVQSADVLHLWLQFYPPDYRKRDDDNAFASFKNARDGIAAALQVDDSKFRMHPRLMPEKRINGLVVATVTTQEP